MNVGLTWRGAMWKAYGIWHFYSPKRLSELFRSSSNSTSTAVPFFISVKYHLEMDYPITQPVKEAPTCSVASEMTGDGAGLGNFVEQEECSIMEYPKEELSEWTDEKHRLYLKSMEATFVDQLYNSLDMRYLQNQYERLSDTMSSRKVHAGSHYPSGEFKVLQHGSWSRIDFTREKSVVNITDMPHFSSSNPWIQHFRKAMKFPSPKEKTILVSETQQTSDSNTEVIDQNFVEEDSAIEKVNTSCGKKRKSTFAVSKLGNDQAASFWHLSCNGNR